jgi:hypothetical protein
MRDEFRDYLFEYRFEESWWSITIRARSENEAKQRLSALAWAQYRGEIFATIRIPGSGIFGWLRKAGRVVLTARKSVED